MVVVAWQEGDSGGDLRKKKRKVINVISIFFGAILSNCEEMYRSSILGR